MKYSKRFKESVLRKVLPPENRSVPEVAREMGISDQPIYNWKKMTVPDKNKQPFTVFPCLHGYNEYFSYRT